MQPAVQMVLTGGPSASLQHGRLWRHVVFMASNRARRLVIFQAEASPQQAESLAAAVRPSFTNIIILKRNRGQCSHSSFYISKLILPKRATKGSQLRLIPIDKQSKTGISRLSTLMLID